jgi:hypothetical protein
MSIRELATVVGRVGQRKTATEGFIIPVQIDDVRQSFRRVDVQARAFHRHRQRLGVTRSRCARRYARGAVMAKARRAAG